MIRYLKLSFRGPEILGDNLYCTITSVKVFGYSMNFMMRKSLTDLQTEHLSSPEINCYDKNNMTAPCIAIAKNNSGLPMLSHQPIVEPLVEIQVEKHWEENDEQLDTLLKKMVAKLNKNEEKLHTLQKDYQNKIQEF